jgi:cytochrome c-type biogenesis protein CcmH
VRRFLALAACAAALAVPAAAAAQSCPTLAEIEREVICPTCNTTLSMSSSPIAERMRAFIRARIAACDSKSEIKAKLVAEFGEGVLAAPPKEGFNLVAWLLPLAGALAGAVALGIAARRWVAGRSASEVPDPTTNGRAPVDLELERRLDEELARFEG